jgi:phage baseplate assembly protein V
VSDGGLRGLRDRIMMMLARGVLRLVYDEPKMQALQVGLLRDETIDRVEHPQPYGFTAHPHPGAECFMAFPGGARNHGIVLMVDDRRYRIRALEQGEVMIYTDEDQDEGGHRIHFKRDRKIEVRAGQEIALVCGNSSMTLRPDSIRVVTPDYAAGRTAEEAV